MANVKSAEKRNRQNIKRRERGKANRNEARTAAHKAMEAIQKDVKSAAETLRNAISILAKTAQKGSIPKERAARKISRLYKALNKATSARA